MSVFSFVLTIGALQWFTGLAFEPEDSAVVFAIYWNLESATESFGFFVDSLDMCFEMGFAEKVLVAVFRVGGTFKRTLISVGAEMFLETAWARKGFITPFISALEFCKRWSA